MRTRTKAQLEQELEDTLIEVESLRQSAINLTKEVHQVRSLNADLAEQVAEAHFQTEKLQGKVGALLSKYSKKSLFSLTSNVVEDLRKILYPPTEG